VRVLVIGGTGFVGSWVVRQFCAAGHAVTVYHRGQTEADLPRGVRQVRSPAAASPITRFPNELRAWNPDAVIHMRAMGEADSRALVDFWRGRARIIVPSSGDVYRAYGRLIGTEPGPPEPVPLTEHSPVREKLYPYRSKASSSSDLSYWYEKILVEKNVISANGTVLRLPKVYGPGAHPSSNSDLATVYGFAQQPHWRWTHGYVENVAAAFVLAAISEGPAGQIYNVGEENTPTVAERLRHLPAAKKEYDRPAEFFFKQHMVYDTSRIRAKLGYRELVPYEEGIKRTLA
jgi:nucleoside-diphosphate-sugar epimerase